MTMFDCTDPAFDVTSPVVHAVREEQWYVETSYGWAVLRHEEGAALLRERRFQQGTGTWPEQNGVPSGLFSDWWKATRLILDGADHLRLLRLPVLSFRPQVRPRICP